MKNRIALATALLPTMILAASHDLGTFIGEYDLDRNGSVSKEEFQKERERRFASTDVNHDGGIAHDEYLEEYRARLMYSKPAPEAVEKQMKQTDVRFKVLDVNKDGMISAAEFTHSGWNMFGEHDYNRDGAVSMDDNTTEKK
jgi:Ca2+-binding EF-hand superfamily protein